MCESSKALVMMLGKMRSIVRFEVRKRQIHAWQLT